MARAADELRDLPNEELDVRLAETKEELFNLRFQLVTGQLDNPMRLKQVRKQIARIMTVMRERELEVLGGPDDEAALERAAAGGEEA